MHFLKAFLFTLVILPTFILEAAVVREEFTDVTYMDTTVAEGHWDTSEGKLKPEAYEDENADGDPNDALINLGKGGDGDCNLASFPNPINTDVDDTYECTSLTLLSGETLTVTGSNPLFIRVLGNATINGSIISNGTNGENAKDVGILGAFNTAGSGGAGGFSGGRGKGAQDGEDGNSAGGGRDGRKGDEGGLQISGTHSGGGGGGGYGLGSGGTLCPATAGTSGNGGGDGGAAGSDDGQTEKFDSTDFDGGSGGGAGGGADLTWATAGKFLAGGAGGGGGGAIAILAGGNLIIGGTVSVNGGDGGDANGVDVGRGAGAGGGGSGGAIWLHSSKAMSISGTVEARGGQGGATDFPGHGEGGNGACGLIRIGDSDGAPSITGTVFPPAQMPTGTDAYANAAYGEDKVTFESLAYDLGTAGAPFTHSIPTFGDDTTNGVVTYRINASNLPTSGWIGFRTLANFSDLDGFRYVKWEIEIDRNNIDAQADTPPTVDFFQWNFDKGPILGIDTLSNDFGSIILPNQSADITITLNNTGDQDATGCGAPSLVGAGASQFSISSDTCGTNNLVSTGSCTFDLRAAPTFTGDHSATVVRSCTIGGSVSSNALGFEASVSLPPLPDITAYTLSPAEYPKGQAIATNSPTNAGGAAASFSISPALPAGLSFNTTNGDITGTPTAATANISYTITATNLGGSDNFILNIEVTDPVVGISATSHDFDVELLNTATADFTFTFTNTGNGDATGCSAPVLGGTDPGQFNISNDTCSTNNLAKNGGTCTVTVNGFPTSLGTKNATLTRTCTNPGATGTVADGIQVVGSNAKLVVDSTTYSFGTQSLNTSSSNASFTYSNPGTANATGCSVSILGGANASDFSISSDACGTSDIVPSGSCDLTVRVTPSGYGTRSATLSKSCTTGGIEIVSLSATVPNPIVVKNEFEGEIEGAACGSVSFEEDDPGGPSIGFVFTFIIGLLLSFVIQLTFMGKERHARE